MWHVRAKHSPAKAVYHLCLEAHHKLCLRLLLHFSPREFSANAPEGE